MQRLLCNRALDPTAGEGRGHNPRYASSAHAMNGTRAPEDTKEFSSATASVLAFIHVHGPSFLVAHIGISANGANKNTGRPLSRIARGNHDRHHAIARDRQRRSKTRPRPRIDPYSTKSFDAFEVPTLHPTSD